MALLITVQSSRLAHSFLRGEQTDHQLMGRSTVSPVVWVFIGDTLNCVPRLVSVLISPPQAHFGLNWDIALLLRCAKGRQRASQVPRLNFSKCKFADLIRRPLIAPPCRGNKNTIHQEFLENESSETSFKSSALYRSQVWALRITFHPKCLGDGHDLAYLEFSRMLT